MYFLFIFRVCLVVVGGAVGVVVSRQHENGLKYAGPTILLKPMNPLGKCTL